MSGKQGKKRKPKKKPKSPIPPQEQSQVSGAPQQKTNLATKLGIGIGLLGLLSLITLYPRLSAASQPPMASDDLVPTFTVTNDGYLKVKDVLLACYFWKTSFRVPNMKLDDVSVSPVGKLVTLGTNDPITIPCRVEFRIPSDIVESMDIGIIAQFRPWPITFVRLRRVFRFVGTNDGKNIIWRKQPPGDMLPAIEAMIKRAPLQ